MKTREVREARHGRPHIEDCVSEMSRTGQFIETERRLQVLGDGGRRSGGLKGFWEFPGGPMVRILCFHGQGYRFNPWLGNKDPACC